MEFNAYQNRLRELASRLSFMGVLLLSFALANVLMASVIPSFFIPQEIGPKGLLL